MKRWYLGIACTLGLAGVASAVVPPIPPIVVIPEIQVEPMPDAATPDDVAKLADRIGKNAKSVRDKLSERDTSPTTIQDQKQLKKDLDRLIDLLQNQPPPPMNNDSSQQPPPPSGGGGSGMGNPPPMGNKPRTGSGRRNQQPMAPMGGQQPMSPANAQPMGMKPDSMGTPMGTKAQSQGQPMEPMGGKPETGGNAGNNADKGGQATPTLPLAETIAKDFWGHLPEVPRQRMMQFFKEQYNSRYKDLLPDYFSTLAEKEKKGKK